MARNKKNKPKAPGDISDNRKARHDYTILQEFECGIALKGTEVKSIRDGHVNLRDSFGRIEKEEVWLYGMDVAIYEKASFEQHPPRRPRKLLLKRKEIATLIGLTAERGCTLVALRAYWKGHLVKIALGVAKGKAQSDKRQALREQTDKREAQREMARFNKGS